MTYLIMSVILIVALSNVAFASKDINSVDIVEGNF
jgi:hypothetical protein